MESKLPKLSSIKRPQITTKSILPSDRIRDRCTNASSSMIAFTANNFTAGSSAYALKALQRKELSTPYQSLSQDILNVSKPINLTMQNKQERAMSPDIVKPRSVADRSKLRRSRSACDIHELRPPKRHEPTLSTIPAKQYRMANNANCADNKTNNGGVFRAPLSRTGTGGGCGAVGKLKRTFARSATTSNLNSETSSQSRGLLSQNNENLKTKGSAVMRGGTGGSVRNVKPLGGATGSNTTSVSTTGAGKTINKRIPPYDFKARYNDLLEKHKALKSKYEEKCEQVSNWENLPEQLEDAQGQLLETEEKLSNIKAENEEMQKQIEAQEEMIERTHYDLQRTNDTLDKLLTSHKKLQIEHKALSEEVIDLRERTTLLTTKNNELLEEVESCKEQIFRSNVERKELHNTVMDLRGNIRVFCRVRPPLANELEKLLCGWNYVDEATVEIINRDQAASKLKNNAHTFNFDQVFHPASNQEEIFELVSPLIQSALDGYNICIFAYGQTGSGKTYTMDGIPTNFGVIPRTVDLLFDSIREYRKMGWEYEIKVQFLEIYNEVLYDLLSNESKEMEIRMVKNSKNDIYVTNIIQETVKDAERLRYLMQVAKSNRATASTVGNERSSRSHAVTKIELIGKHAEKQEISVGSINLVDLAGSESPKTSVRMNETKNINRSLSELTNVILALLQKQDHIPYRNSKLTHLLMPSLGGNSKTLMFINVAPFQDCFVESLKSLRFAATVNQCKMAKAKRNRVLNTSSVANTSTNTTYSPQ